MYLIRWYHFINRLLSKEIQICIFTVLGKHFHQKQVAVTFTRQKFNYLSKLNVTVFGLRKNNEVANFIFSAKNFQPIAGINVSAVNFVSLQKIYDSLIIRDFFNASI